MFCFVLFFSLLMTRIVHFQFQKKNSQQLSLLFLRKFLRLPLLFSWAKVNKQLLHLRAIIVSNASEIFQGEKIMWKLYCVQCTALFQFRNMYIIHSTLDVPIQF